MTTMAPHNPDAQKVELLLAQLEAVPPLDTIATQILNLTREDSTCRADQLVELISVDPALTARLLSILGRAEHGLHADVVNIENAVRMLGFNTVRQVTLALKIMDVFSNQDTTSRESCFDRNEFWKHCLAVACAARKIALVIKGSAVKVDPPVPHKMPLSNSIEPDEAFVCGLLHDIGKIALATTLPKTFDRIIRTADETHGNIADVEREVLGMDHAVIGHRLAERWALPARLTDCIWLHHHRHEALPPSVAASGYVQIVQLADTLAREQHIGYSGNHRLTMSSGELSERLGLSAEQRQQIFESLADEIEKRVSWIGADQINAREVYLKALMQATEELTTANSELIQRNRRLQRQSQFFQALRELNRSMSSRATVREVCSAGAVALRLALAVSEVAVFVNSADDPWLEVGLSDGNVQGPIGPLEIDSSAESQTAALVELSRAGHWISTPLPAFQPVVDRFRGMLGEGPIWLLPLVRQQRWIGGALFAAPAQQVVSFKSDSDEIEALSAAVGLSVAQAQSRAAAIAMRDELAEVNRRLLSMQGELLRTRALESVVNMAAGAAHELNNPLSVISGRAQLLRQKIDDPDVREVLDTMTHHAQLCSDIVTELMAFAKSPAPRPESVDLLSSLTSLRSDLASDELLESDDLDLEVASDTPPVWFDRRHLTLVFKEILNNAIQATDRDSRRLTVKASRQLTEEWVRVTVTDNGRGMTPNVLVRAMDPFFSHRPAGRSRGLGLSRVQRWLKQGGGTIRMESEPHKGTCIELHLPVSRDIHL